MQMFERMPFSIQKFEEMKWRKQMFGGENDVRNLKVSRDDIQNSDA